MSTIIIFVFVLLRVAIAFHSSFVAGPDILCNGTNQCQYRHIISGTECNIDCTASGSCRNADLVFSQNCDFGNLNCSAFHACYASDIVCASGGYCEINTGIKSIKRSTVHCSSNGICLLYCNDIESCASADIHCADGSQCFVECHGDSACSGITLHAEAAQSLHILCKDAACSNLQAHCPVNNTHDHHPYCLLDVYGDKNEGIEIYAMKGLSQDIRVVNHDRNAPQITFYCEVDYSSICKILPASGQCTEALHICNNDANNGVISTTNATISNNRKASAKQSKFTLKPYIHSIRNNKLLLWVTLLGAIMCTMICCYICCDGFRFMLKMNKNADRKHIRNAFNPRKRRNIFIWDTDFEGCNADFRRNPYPYFDDDSVHSDSISISI